MISHDRETHERRLTAHFDDHEIQAILVNYLAKAHDFVQNGDTKTEVHFRFVDRDTRGHCLEADVTIVQNLEPTKP